MVIPVFRSSQSISDVVHQTVEQMETLGVQYEVILVDDGSEDDTWNVVEAVVKKLPRVRGLRFGRNFGQHSALLAGIREARYSITVTLDDDLQNPPSQIPLLLEPLTKGHADVVYGVPRASAQTAWRRFLGKSIRGFLGRSLGINEALDLSSFRAFRTDLRNGFKGNLGRGISIDALLAWSTDSFRAVTVEHKDRENGSSNYSLRKLLLFAIDTVTGYSAMPLRFASVLGFSTSLLGIVLLAVFVLLPVIQGISIQGFPFLASTIILFSGIQLLTLGVISEYLSRMHFRVMNKPEYFIMEEIFHDSV